MNRSANINIPSYCACMAVRKASRAITKLYDQALAPSGLKITQFSLLMSIRKNGPINTSTLAKLQSLDRTTLVRNLKPLELAAFIEAVPSRDPRERRVCITDHGLQTLKSAMPRWKAIQHKLAERIGMVQLDILEGFASNMEDLLAGEDD